ncbi:hypothetical protein [Marinobacter salicampi]|uniref:hypothetical protein n=1 Tax=Marinobacter salicampi TaxID=435907 RepID=UPI001407A7E3|nr:hypothetical protein [Marinobacter salicampi]
MRYLESPAYNRLLNDKALTVYTEKDTGGAAETEFEWLIDVKKMLEQPINKTTSTGIYKGKPAILKVNTLRYLSQRVRARLGIKRHGRYEWATAELHTAIRMQKRPYIPELFAYGWSTNRAGLPVKTFSVTRNLTDTLTLEEFVTSHPESIGPALTLAFDTLLIAIRDRLLHLDPWAGNFLLTRDLKNCWLIDLEFSKLNSSACIEQQLGFSFGFFFNGKFSTHVDRTVYLAFIERWARTQTLKMNVNTLLNHTQFYLENTLKRKKRFAAF